MIKGNISYSIIYKVAYTISNTHHMEYFAQKDYIVLPELFQEIGKVYPSQYSDQISFVQEFVLDISDKPKMIELGSSSQNRLNVNEKNQVGISKRIALKPLEGKNKIKNFCIQGEYYNGL